MRRRLALLLALRASKAQTDHPCDLTPATVARINDWILNGNDPGDGAFEALHCAAVTTVGTAVGGLGGGAAGALLGGRASARISKALCGNGTSACHGVTEGATRLVGGLLGYVIGAATGAEASHRFFGRGSFFGSPSRTAAIHECAELFGIEENADVSVIDRAYKARTLKDHPDKGGSNEAMARLNVCRAVLRANANRKWEL